MSSVIIYRIHLVLWQWETSNKESHSKTLIGGRWELKQVLWEYRRRGNLWLGRSRKASWSWCIKAITHFYVFSSRHMPGQCYMLYGCAANFVCVLSRFPGIPFILDSCFWYCCYWLLRPTFSEELEPPGPEVTRRCALSCRMACSQGSLSWRWGSDTPEVPRKPYSSTASPFMSGSSRTLSQVSPGGTPSDALCIKVSQL